MRILLIHNFYRQPGGEDVAFREESLLLQKHGHSVAEYTDQNQSVETPYAAAKHVLWSRESYLKIRDVLEKTTPDVVHIHNTFFIISPSVYYACYLAGVPVVQTLHNYRVICPVGTFYRSNRVCEECNGKKVPFPSVIHGCYHNSRVESLGVAAMLTFHNAVGTWQDKISIYIALTKFGKEKFTKGGFPPEKIIVKPNFIDLDLSDDIRKEDFVLFVGRLTQDKGIYTLIETWNSIHDLVPLRIVGDGPLVNFVAQSVKEIDNIKWLGKIPRSELIQLMTRARFLIVPSEWYEGFPMVIVEAFACGLPVIASNHGSLSELIKNGKTGLVFNPGDSNDLAEKVTWAWNHSDEMAEMGRNARKEYEEKYTAEKNYVMLMNIYQKAIDNHKKRNL